MLLWQQSRYQTNQEKHGFKVNLKLEPENGKKIAKLGEMIKVGLLCLALHNMLKKLQQKGIVKVSCQEQHPVEHPTMSYPGPDILVFTGPPRPGSGASATNTVVMSNGQLDWNRPDTFTAMLDRQARMSHSLRQEKIPGRHVGQALQLLWQPERPEEP